MPECHDIQQLCHMRPDHAVNEAQALVPIELRNEDGLAQGLSDHLENDSVWKEISANILNGEVGIIGSGRGLNLLHAFAWTGHQLAVELLLENGTDINAVTSKMCWTALHIAISKSLSTVADKLIERRADLEMKDRNGFTPLILACACGSTEGVKLLLENGAHLNAQDNKGNTALIEAIKGKFQKIVTLLLDGGADAEAKNKRGETALSIAARQGSIDIVKELLDYGVERELNYPSGHTPREIALKQGYHSIAQLLQIPPPRKTSFIQRFTSKKDKQKISKEKVMENVSESKPPTEVIKPERREENNNITERDRGNNVLSTETFGTSMLDN